MGTHFATHPRKSCGSLGIALVIVIWILGFIALQEYCASFYKSMAGFILDSKVKGITGHTDNSTDFSVFWAL